MSTTPPFLAGASRPIEFIPVPQDAEKYNRLKTAQLRKRDQANERLQTENDNLFNANERNATDHITINDVIELERIAIRDEYALRDKTLASMREFYPVPQMFLITVPTTNEREQINSRLVSLGLRQVTQEQIRATMVEELFEQDWAAPGETLTPAENEARAEETANFLDSVWMRQEAHDAAIQQWQEQEIERVIDEAEGAPPVPRADMPPKIISMRESARMQLLVDRMMTASQRLRDLAAANLDFGRQNALLLVRMHVVGIVGFEPKVPIERDKRTNALPGSAVLALREQVDDPSWQDLVGFIDRLYSVDKSEEKNSDSLLEKQPHPDGSIERSDAPASSGGNSTVSSSEPVLAGGSATTTDPSFNSTSGSSTTPAPTEPVSLTVVD